MSKLINFCSPWKHSNGWGVVICLNLLNIRSGIWRRSLSLSFQALQDKVKNLNRRRMVLYNLEYLGFTTVISLIVINSSVVTKIVRLNTWAKSGIFKASLVQFNGLVLYLEELLSSWRFCVSNWNEILRKKYIKNKKIKQKIGKGMEREY